MQGFSGMMTVDFNISPSELKHLVKKFSLIAAVSSLGGVETIVSFPFESTHTHLPKEEINAYGIFETMLRVSVGIEDLPDIIADFEQAVQAAGLK